LHQYGSAAPAAAERFRAVRDTHTRNAANARRGTVNADTDPERLRTWAKQLRADGRARSAREAFEIIGAHLHREPTYLERRARRRTSTR
jgi:hypothetical protein